MCTLDPPPRDCRGRLHRKGFLRECEEDPKVLVKQQREECEDEGCLMCQASASDMI